MQWETKKFMWLTLTQHSLCSAVWHGTHNIPTVGLYPANPPWMSTSVAPTLCTVCHCSAWTEGSQYAHRHEPNLSRRQRNWGATRTPGVEPGASEERGDALVFPKQLLHLLNFIPCTCITYSKKCTFILNASKTPTAYTYCLNLPHHLHSPTMDLSITHVLHLSITHVSSKYSGWHRRPRRGNRILPCVGTVHVHRWTRVPGGHACATRHELWESQVRENLCSGHERKKSRGFSSSELDWEPL